VHETVTVRKTIEAEIDRALVPLINQLWRHGMWTVACCEGNPYRGFVRDDAYVILALDYHAHILSQELAAAGIDYDRQGTRLRFAHEDIGEIVDHLKEQPAPLGQDYDGPATTRIVFGRDGTVPQPKKHKKRKGKKKG
jgi:hypothetical protein